MDYEAIEKIIFTLEKIEVHGSENLSRLLGCIQELQRIAKEIECVKK